MLAIAYVDGHFLPRENAYVHIDDRGFLLGDAVFETARWRHGSFFRLKQHLDRLRQSAETMSIAMPDTDLVSIAADLAQRSNMPEASLRITLTAGRGGKGLSRKGAAPPSIVMTMNPVAADWQHRAANGWTVRTSPFHKPAQDSTPAHLKAVGRTFSQLAFLEAEAAGFDDALLLSATGLIAEGPTWNVFWRAGDSVFTPSLDVGVLEGVTRSIIAEIARDAGFAVHEVAAPRSALESADEIFATMTSLGVVPFAQLDARQFRLCEDSAASLIQNRYWSRVDAELAQRE